MKNVSISLPSPALTYLLQPLCRFLSSATHDARIGSGHISLFVSLYQCWLQNHGTNPVYFSKSAVMKVSKICGSATYHRNIKDLHQYGYLEYVPSYHPFGRTKVYLKNELSLGPVSFACLPESTHLPILK
jgi:hypothetical protein